jgi:putative oxidoreductase
MGESAAALIAPQLAGLYEWLAPWAYALLRAAVGLLLLPHGLRSCFGFFSSTGRVSDFAHMAAEMKSSGYRPGRFWALVAALTIFIAGPMLAFGLFTRPAAAIVFVFLVLSTVDHARIGGYFCNRNGLEFPLLWSIAAFCFVVNGGGPYSLDRMLLAKEF